MLFLIQDGQRCLMESDVCACIECVYVYESVCLCICVNIFVCPREYVNVCKPICVFMYQNEFMAKNVCSQ